MSSHRITKASMLPGSPSTVHYPQRSAMPTSSSPSASMAEQEEARRIILKRYLPKTQQSEGPRPRSKGRDAKTNVSGLQSEATTSRRKSAATLAIESAEENGRLDRAGYTYLPDNAKRVRDHCREINPRSIAIEAAEDDNVLGDRGYVESGSGGVSSSFETEPLPGIMFSEEGKYGGEIDGTYSAMFDPSFQMDLGSLPVESAGPSLFQNEQNAHQPLRRRPRQTGGYTAAPSISPITSNDCDSTWNQQVFSSDTDILMPESHLLRGPSGNNQVLDYSTLYPSSGRRDDSSGKVTPSDAYSPFEEWVPQELDLKWLKSLNPNTTRGPAEAQYILDDRHNIGPASDFRFDTTGGTQFSNPDDFVAGTWQGLPLEQPFQWEGQFCQSGNPAVVQPGTTSPSFYGEQCPGSDPGFAQYDPMSYDPQPFMPVHSTLDRAEERKHTESHRMFTRKDQLSCPTCFTQIEGFGEPCFQCDGISGARA